MTNKQVERYLDILEERNRIASRVESKMQTRSDDFDLRNGHLISLNNISDSICIVSDIANAINDINN